MEDSVGGKRAIYSYVFVRRNMHPTKYHGVWRRRYEKYPHIVQQLVFIEIHQDTKPGVPRVHLFFLILIQTNYVE